MIGKSFALLVAVTCALLPALPANTNESPAARARQWVRELGAPEFHVRERAAGQLRALGQEARPALEELENAADPEVRLQVQELLGDLRLGIAADWPVELQQAVRGIAGHAPAERVEIMRRVTAALQVRAIGFLLARSAADSREEQEAALQLIHGIQPRETAAREVIRWSGPPPTAAQRRLRAWAFGELGEPLEGLKIVGADPADARTRRDLAEKAVGQLQTRIRREAARELAEVTRQLTEVMPEESRFWYLRGMVAAFSGQATNAQAFAGRAVALNPQDEAPHFSAAIMLCELGQENLAEQELELILKIPPANDVYDLNAYFKLAPIQANQHRYAEAAESYSKGLRIYRQARAAGQGMALVGAEEEQVELQIAALRRRAAKIAQQDFTLRLAQILKDPDPAKWRAATDGVVTIVTIRVEPLGLRLLDVEGATLRYDAVEKQLVPMLRDQRAGDSFALDLQGKNARIQVNSLDCSYVYEIDATTGGARQVARLERDYRVQIVPGPRVRALREIVATINGETNDWPQAQAGITFDYLPEKMAIEVRGRSTNDTWETIRQVIPVTEPPLKVLSSEPPK